MCYLRSCWYRDLTGFLTIKSFAKRLERFVHIVGRDRVIAGSDCGFGTFAGFGTVDPEIAYAKLASLSQGAQKV